MKTLLQIVMANLLGLLAAVLLGGCTTVSVETPTGTKLSYTNTVFQKEIGTASVAPDGTFKIEGVKNSTPQIVEAAVHAAIDAAK